MNNFNKFNIELSKYFNLKLISNNSVAIILRDGVEIDSRAVRSLEYDIKKSKKESINNSQYKLVSYRLLTDMVNNLREGKLTNLAHVSESDINILKSEQFLTELKQIIMDSHLDIDIDICIRRIKEVQDELNDFNNRIDNAIEKRLGYGAKLRKSVSKKLYKISQRFTSKEELQILYEKFVRTLTGNNCEFIKVYGTRGGSVNTTLSDSYKQVEQIEKLCEKDPFKIIITSKKSKFTDFLAAFYSMEKGIGMIPNTVDDETILNSINTDKFVVCAMAYKLGLIKGKEEMERVIDNLDNNGRNMLIRLEEALELS